VAGDECRVDALREVGPGVRRYFARARRRVARQPVLNARRRFGAFVWHPVIFFLLYVFNKINGTKFNWTARPGRRWIPGGFAGGWMAQT